MDVHARNAFCSFHMFFHKILKFVANSFLSMAEQVFYTVFIGSVIVIFGRAAMFQPSGVITENGTSFFKFMIQDFNIFAQFS